MTQAAKAYSIAIALCFASLLGVSFAGGFGSSQGSSSGSSVDLTNVNDNVALRSDHTLGWSDSTDNTTTVDTRLARSAANTLRVDDGSGGVANLDVAGASGSKLYVGNLQVDNQGAAEVKLKRRDDTDDVTLISSGYRTSLNDSLVHTLGLSLASDVGVRWSSGTSATGPTYDLRLVRSAASALTVDDGAGGAATAIASVFSGSSVIASVVSATDYRTWEATAGVHEFVHVQHQESSGTSGGAFTAGAWQVMTLNTKVADSASNCVLANNQMLLAAGTYEISARKLIYRTDSTRLRLRNVTAGSTLLLGVQAGDNSSSGGGVILTVNGRFTLTVSSEVELQGYCQSTRDPDGQGAAITTGDTEVYADVYLRKVD